MVLIDDLYIKSIEEGEKALYNYSVNQKKAKSSRQQKAEIIFPVALCEKFLRDFGNSKLMITKWTRNIPNLKIIDQEGTNIYDLLKYKNVIFTTTSIKSLQERLSKWKNFII